MFEIEDKNKGPKGDLLRNDFEQGDTADNNISKAQLPTYEHTPPPPVGSQLPSFGEVPPPPPPILPNSETNSPH